LTDKLVYRISEDIELRSNTRCDACGCKTLVFTLTFCGEKYCMDCLQCFVDKYEAACEDEEWS
jgi:hypothetical protein